jgi:hypothetical protein
MGAAFADASRPFFANKQNFFGNMQTKKGGELCVFERLPFSEQQQQQQNHDYYDCNNLKFSFNSLASVSKPLMPLIIKIIVNYTYKSILRGTCKKYSRE